MKEAVDEQKDLTLAEVENTLGGGTGSGIILIA